ncbi:hypothetical protein Tco_0357755, partial [Tanacetum coccineum]
SVKEKLTIVRIKNDSLRDENVSIKKRYQYLYKSKAESNSNVSNGAAVPKKPKVLASGLYAMTPKYVPPQKRNNREANTPLPRKETDHCLRGRISATNSLAGNAHKGFLDSFTFFSQEMYLI